MALTHEFVTLSNAVLGAASRVFARATQGTGGDGTRNLGDEVPVACALGVTAMPSDDSNARGVLLRNVSGAVGAVVGAFANGLGDIAGNLVKGDTVVHATGPDHGTRIYLKEQVIELVITGGEGDNNPDVLVQIDREDKKIQLNIEGNIMELSDANGFRVDLAGGTSSLIMTPDEIWLKAPNVLITDKAAVPMASGTAGPAPAPISSVLGPSV